MESINSGGHFYISLGNYEINAFLINKMNIGRYSQNVGTFMRKEGGIEENEKTKGKREETEARLSQQLQLLP